MKGEQITKEYLNKVLDQKFGNFESKFDQKLGNFESKFDQKFDNLESKFDQKLGNFESRFDQKLENLEIRTDKKFKTFSARMDKGFKEAKADRQSIRKELSQKIEDSQSSLAEMTQKGFEAVNNRFDIQDAKIDRISKIEIPQIKNRVGIIEQALTISK